MFASVPTWDVARETAGSLRSSAVSNRWSPPLTGDYSLAGSPELLCRNDHRAVPVANLEPRHTVAAERLLKARPFT